MVRDTVGTERSLHIGMQERELYVLLPMLIAFAAGTHKLANVIDRGQRNRVSYMRTVRLQNALRQHERVQVATRDAAGVGMTLSWPHLVYFLLYLLAVPLMRLRAAWRRGRTQAVPVAVRAIGVMSDRLNQGRLPLWLKRLDEDPLSGNVLYEVMP